MLYAISLLAGLIVSRGSTVVTFYEQIRVSQDSSNSKSSAALVGQILLATFDFDVFMVMMREAKEELAFSHK